MIRLAVILAVAAAILGASPANAQCGSDPGNDSLGAASDLFGECGTTAAGIDCDGDVDFYTFTAQTASSYTFTVGATNSVVVTLYNSAQNVVEQTNSSVSKNLSVGETVYVCVAPVNQGEVFQYGLTASGCSGGGCPGDGPDNDWSSAPNIPGCTNVTSAVDCVGDEDYYRFRSPAPRAPTGSATWWCSTRA